MFESLSVVKVAVAVRNLHSDKDAGVDEIWPEILTCL